MRRFFYLSKRLFKKKSYLLLLAFVPLLVAALRGVSTQDSGFVKIVLYAEEKEGLADEVIASLLSQESVVLFETAECLEEAYDKLNRQQADAIWIFHADFDRLLAEFAKSPENVEQQGKPVTIVEREDNVMLLLTREKLYGVVAPHLYYVMYQEYVTSLLPETEAVPEQELLKIYEESAVIDTLVDFAHMDGTAEERTSYLVAPLQGLLSLLVVLAGFAATMFFMKDEENGVFDRIALEKRQQALYLYQFTVAFYVGIAVLLALYFSGLFTGFGYEITALFLLILMCMGFCSLCKRILKYPRRIGIAMVISLLLMLVFCPVFFHVKKVRLLQCLLPPYYYLSAAHNTEYLKHMLVYACVAFAVNGLWNAFRMNGNNP